MAKLIEIEGAGGGGKSGGSTSGPVEAPNTLQSFARAKFVDLLLEGVIEGWADADPAKCIILNKVAVKNPDGSTNYKGLSHVFLPGTSDQPAMPGFENITTERDVGRRVRNDTPVIYPTVGDSLTAIIPTVLIPALTVTDKKNGNVNGGSVSIAIDIRSQSNNANQWIENVVVDTISGKNTASYERSYFIALDGAGPWLVRMRRTSPDTNDVTIQDQTMFSHITEVIEHRISYSDSAVVGIEIDAEQFGTSIAERSYDLLLQHIEYPSNYNPKTRVYTGFWDGTFKTGWCDNPAWVFRTIGTNERFGADVDPRYMDKWGLYTLAKFNDELVPDGRGGMEPRFVFNGLLKTQQDAYKVLQQIASMMRSIVFYGAGSVIIRQDRPMQAERNLYTPANVITEFNYGSTALRVRHNSAVVQWINPSLGYDTDYTMYDEGPHIIQFGRNQLSLQAIGTTSEGQAYRQGKWAVLTELYQTDTVTFTAGKDSADALPGDVIEIADPHWATADFGGRVVPLGDNVIPYATAKASTWTQSSVTPAIATMKPGTRGATQLTGFVNGNAANAGALTSATIPHSAGLYTASIYVDRTSWPYVVFGINGFALASFNVKTDEVRAKTPGVIAAWTENEGLDLIRLCITYRVTDTTPRSLYVGFEGPNLGISGSSNTILSSRPVPLTATLYVGSPQLDADVIATRYCPPLADRNSQLVLDRDVDFSDTGPQLHVTMLDGNYDDVDGVDNTDRPARRKVNVRSFNVIGWDAELGVISLASSIPIGGNDFETPFIWIFSKDQLKPRKWKIVSIEESDDREYNIVAINYAPEKFSRMDENYILHEQDEGPFTNLPNTTFCYPPKNIHATYQTQLKNGIITASVNVSWEASPDKFLNGYVLAYRRNNDNWVTLPLTTEISVDFTDMPIGTYQFALRAVNKFGVASNEISTAIDINEISVEGKTLVYGIVTDRGDTTFTDRDIKIFWQSNALSADPSLASVTATVYSDNNPGFLLEDGGYMVQEDLQNPFGLEVSDDNVITIEDADGDTPRLTVKGATWDDEQVTIRIGLSAFYVAAAVGDTSAKIATKIANVVNPDPRFNAVAVGDTVTISYAIGGTNASEMEAVNDPLFKAYVVKVIDPATNRVMQTDYVKTPEYRYSYSVNVKNSGTPLRAVRFSIAVQDVNDKVSTPTITVISNPAPVFNTAEIIATFGEVKLRFTAPVDPDFAGIIVWMGLATGFIPSEQNKYWQDRGQPAIPAPPGTKVYIRYAYYDLFGTTGITLSPEVPIDVPDIAVSDIDSTPPPIPTTPTTPLTYVVTLDAGKNPVITQTFTWNAVIADDVAGYDIQYREGTGSWIGGYGVAKEYTSHSLPVKANTQYSAQVRAYDRVGNVSGWSSIATAISGKDNVPPGPPTGIVVNTSLGMTRLKWDNDTAADLTNVEVWESSTPNLANANLRIVLNANPGKVGGYIRNLLSGEKVYFWLKSFDSSGNGSAFTAMIGPVSSDLIRYDDFTPNVRPIGNLTGLPDPNGYTGPSLVFNTTDGKLYAYQKGPPASWASATGIENNSITTEMLVTGAVTGEKLALAAVTADKIAANSIATNKLVVASRPLSTTGINLRINKLGECVWDNGYVNIVGNDGSSNSYFVTAGRLYGKYLMYSPGRPSFDQTNDDAVLQDPNSRLIATWEVGTSNLVVYAGVASLLNGDRIVTGSMNANKIMANTITADQILAGTIGAAQIAAGAISTDKLLVMQAGSALNRDPNFSDPSVWRDLNSTAYFDSIADGLAGSSSLVIKGQNQGVSSYTTPVALDRTKTYRFRGLSRARARGGYIYMGVALTDANGNNISGDGTWWNYVANHVDVGFDWTAFEGQFGSGTSRPFPTNARFMYPVVIGNYWNNGETTSSVHEFQDVRIEEVLPGIMLKDGVITTQKLAAFAVTAANIAGGTITGDKISTTTSLPGTITVGNTGVTIATVQSTAQQALDKANSNGSVSDALIAAITSDNKLSQGEKSELIARYQQAEQDYTGAYNQSVDMIASWGDVTLTERQNLVTYWQNLTGYLNTLSPPWNDITTISDVNGTFLRGKFSDLYSQIATTLASVARINSAVTANPAKRINENTTLIDPGRLSVSGSYTFDNWKNGPNSTDIRGGAIGANTIDANKMKIGMRGLSFLGINFEYNPSQGWVQWTEGYIYYIDSNNVSQGEYIPAGNTGASAPHLFLYWYPGAGAVNFNQNNPASNDSIMLASWWGGSNINANYGGTIINGDRITTGTVDANRIKANTVLANTIQVSGYGTLGDVALGGSDPAAKINSMPTTINGGKITTGSLTALQIAANTITADRMNVTSLAAINANLGTVTAGVVQSTDGRVRFDLNAGTFSMASATSGQRFYLDTNGIRIYDSANTLRIRIGL